MSAQLAELGADPDRVVYNPYGPRDYFYDSKSDYRSPFSPGLFLTKRTFA